MKRSVVLMLSLIMTVGIMAQNKSKSTKPAPAKTSGTSSVSLKSALDSFSYAMGMSVGKFYKQQGLTSIKSDLMLKGIGDAMKDNSKPLLDEMQANMCIQSYVTDLKNKKSSETKAIGQR